MVEIMSPAGNFESLSAAIKAGADAIYFGVGKLNMRSYSSRFSEEDLEKIIDKCKKAGVKSYLTVNSVMYDEDLDEMRSLITKAKKAGVDAVIGMDIAVLEYCKKIGQTCHASTQLNISNIEAVKFFSKYCDAIVLARELNLTQIKNIIKKIKEEKIKGPSGNLIKIEIFVHGALCISVSGKCFMSLSRFNRSANRGECFQPCRRAYKIIDEEDGEELKIENKYVLSPSDLCTLPFLDKILESGVEILKIEGRARPPEYVFTTTKVYKEAVNSIKKNDSFHKNINKWMEKLKSVYNRGFWEGGYYLGKKLNEWSATRGSKATTKKILVGKVKNFFAKKNIAQIEVKGDELKVGDKILFTGPTTGVLEINVKEIFDNGKKVSKAQGDKITLKVPERVRESDRVFIIRYIQPQ